MYYRNGLNSNKYVGRRTVDINALDKVIIRTYNIVIQMYNTQKGG